MGAAVALMNGCESDAEDLFPGQSAAGTGSMAQPAGTAGTAGFGGSAGAGGSTGGGSVDAALGGTAPSEPPGAPPASGGTAGSPNLVGQSSGGVSGSEAGLAPEGGQGGSPPEPEPTCLAEYVIDDLEDRNDAICRGNGHVGRWFTSNDGTPSATQDPPLLAVVRPEPIVDRPGSEFAVRTSGRGFKTWGAALGFEIRAVDATAYDASAFEGLTFYAKGAVAGKVRVAVRLRDFAPSEQGGKCNPDSGNCFRYHGADLTVTEEWEQYRVPFTRLVREDNWDPAFDASQIVGVEFRVPPPGSLEPFELWIDDVAFEPILE